jgi:hypothetical protein
VKVGRERAVLLCVLALAMIGCGFNLIAEPSPGLQATKHEQVLALLHVLCTTALVLALLLGPGVLWRALGEGRRPSLGFLPLPGLGLLIAIAGLAWALSNAVEPRIVCLAVSLPILAAMFAGLLRCGPGDIFDREERRCLLVVGCVLGLAISRALWSLGPEGELYEGMVSRTLEVGDRPDSRISFIVPQMVAHGAGPYSPIGSYSYSPYNFSSRGPLSGLASTPIVLASGGHPPAKHPEEPWAPFDWHGFMAYRIAMMAFACTAFFSLWDLIRRLGGTAAAGFGLLLAATTPFLVHEVWFTWPKLLAASFVLLAAICVIERRPLFAGLLAGAGYLMHPVALLSLPALALIALWPLRGARWNRPRIKQAALLGAGAAVFLVAWRLINGSHYQQSEFINYFTQAWPLVHPTLGQLLEYRLESLGNTLVPFMLLATSSASPSINVFGGSSPPVVHFFFQYWDTLPFGLSIVFFPLLLLGLWRAWRRWRWPVLATVVVPLAIFTVYWGASSTGMLREGLQVWTLTVLVALACEQAARGFSWLRSRPIRGLLALRALEVLALATVPAFATQHEVISGNFKLTDAVAVLGLFAFGTALAALVWSWDANPAPRENVRRATARPSGNPAVALQRGSPPD